MSVDIKLEGLEKLEKKLGKLGAKKWKRQAIRAAGKQVIRKTSPYPSYTPDKSRLWYQRGHGTRWRRKDGSIGGNKSSESLSKKWYMKSQPDRVIVGNPVTYAEHVHGDNRGHGQTDIHHKRGHHILIKVAENELPVIVDKLSKQLDRILRG